MQSMWLIIAVTTVVATVAGVLLTLLVQRYRKPRSLLEIEAAHAHLQQQVADHFVKTAELVNEMTDSYKAVFDHLNAGANTLVDKQVLHERLPQKTVPQITLGHIGQQTQSEHAGDGAVTVDSTEPEQEVQTTGEDEPLREPPRY